MKKISFMLFALLCTVAQGAWAESLTVEWPYYTCRAVNCLSDGYDVVNKNNSYGGIIVTYSGDEAADGFYYGMISLEDKDSKLIFSTDVYKISKIEISTPDMLGSKSFSNGWSFDGSSHLLTWSGTPASSVALSATGSPYFGVEKIVFTLDELIYDRTVSINDGPVTVPAGGLWKITGTGEPTTNTITVGYGGAIVTLSGVNIDTYYDAIECMGSATILLDEGTTNTLTAEKSAIKIGNEGTLTVLGNGTLTTQSGIHCAGLGSNTDGNCGDIIIKSGNITAKGGWLGAGIGGGKGRPCGNITISGGNITAIGGGSAAGIGSGSGSSSGGSSCGNITISGGTVVAIGGEEGAGIGGGWDASYADITIEGGNVTATGGEYAAAIGSGRSCTNGGVINITNEVNSLIVTKSAEARNNIGEGYSGRSGKVFIDGVQYWDGAGYRDGGEDWLACTSMAYLKGMRTIGIQHDEYWTTFYSTAGHFLAPTGTLVYRAAFNKDAVALTPITDRIVNSGQGVVLKSTSPNFILTSNDTESERDYSANQLVGTAAPIANPGNAYVLDYDMETGVGFYKLSATGTIDANKAYLLYEGSADEHPYFNFDIGMGEATGLTSLTPGPSPEGEGSGWYTIDGRRLDSQPAACGIYIHNGKKQVIK